MRLTHAGIVCLPCRQPLGTWTIRHSDSGLRPCSKDPMLHYVRRRRHTIQQQQRANQNIQSQALRTFVGNQRLHEFQVRSPTFRRNVFSFCSIRRVRDLQRRLAMVRAIMVASQRMAYLDIGAAILPCLFCVVTVG